MVLFPILCLVYCFLILTCLQPNMSLVLVGQLLFNLQNFSLLNAHGLGYDLRFEFASNSSLPVSLNYLFLSTVFTTA